MNEYQEYLVHHGVKGMKWGVIREKLSNFRKNRKARKEEKVQAKKDKIAAKEAKKREKRERLEEALGLKTKKGEDLSQLSDNDIRDRINRMKLEEEYTRAKIQKAERSVGKAKKYLGQALESFGSSLANRIGNDMATKVADAIKNAGNSKKDKADRDARAKTISPDIMKIVKNLSSADPNDIGRAADWFNKANTLQRQMGAYLSGSYNPNPKGGKG